MKIGKEIWFDASHQLAGTGGPCDRLHGHSYCAEIEVEGEVSERTGMVVDFSILSEVVQGLDHQHLNDLPQFIGKPVTAEHISQWIADAVARRATKAVVKVRLWETRSSYVEAVSRS